MSEKGGEPKFKVAYIGLDYNYWSTLMDVFKENLKDKGPYEFRQFFKTEDENLHDVYLELIYGSFNVVFLDFSKREDEVLYLARLLRGGKVSKEISVVGLFNYLASDELKQRATFTGVLIHHIKGADIPVVALQGLGLCDPELDQSDKYALGKLDEPKALPFWGYYRVGYLKKEGVHIETNCILKKSECVETQSSLVDEKVLTPFLDVAEKKEQELYFLFNYSYFLKVTNKKRFKTEKGSSIKADPDGATVQDLHYRIDKWIAKKNADENKINYPKLSKVLIIDSKMKAIYESTHSLDKYPYSMKIRPYLLDIGNEFNHMRPHIIIYEYEEDHFEKNWQKIIDRSQSENRSIKEIMDEMDKELEEKNIKDQEVMEAKESDEDSESPVQEGEVEVEEGQEVDSDNEEGEGGDGEKKEEEDVIERPVNDANTLQTIVHYINSVENYKPIIIVFSGPPGLKESIQYDQMITYTESCNLDVVLKMAELHQKKLQNSLGSDFVKKQVFFGQSVPGALGLITFEMELLAMSESIIYFATDRELKLFSSYKMDFPIELWFTVVPGQDLTLGENIQINGTIYKGFIHSVNEKQKEALRRYVQSLFFQEKDKEEAQERLEYLERQKKYLEDKQKQEEEEKKAQEEDSEDENKSEDNKKDDSDGGGEQKAS